MLLYILSPPIQYCNKKIIFEIILVYVCVLEGGGGGGGAFHMKCVAHKALS